MQKLIEYEPEAILLELLFDTSGAEKLILFMNKSDAKSMTLFDFAQLNYISNSKNIVIRIDEIRDIINNLKTDLKLCLKNKELLHPSIKKPLGFYYSKFCKKAKRKDLIYETLTNGYTRWVGLKYRLFDSVPGMQRPASWLYKSKTNKIILEISQTYPYQSDTPKTNKNFLKFSEWMKNYTPEIVTEIPIDSAKQWIKNLGLLMQKVRRSDKKFRCTGPGCKHCAKEGKTGCPCGSKL